MDRFNSWLTAIANIGVLVGVVFVVLEIRQNTDAIQASTTVSLEQNIASLIANWASSVEHAALFRKGAFSEEELSSDERIWVDLLLRQLFLHMDSFYWAHRSGVLPNELWEREERVMRVYVNSPGGHRVWSNSPPVSEPFVEYVESQLMNPE
jgi:hypothetical protein